MDDELKAMKFYYEEVGRYLKQVESKHNERGDLALLGLIDATTSLKTSVDRLQFAVEGYILKM